MPSNHSGAATLVIEELFNQPTENQAPTRRQLWRDRDVLRRWLQTVFDGILASPPGEFRMLDVPPHRLIPDDRNLFSVSLLSITTLVSDDAEFTTQDFAYMFCDEFISYFNIPEYDGNLFLLWTSNELFRTVEKNPRIDFAPADFICDHLQYQARHDQLLSRLRIKDRANFVPLLVSCLFAIHIGGLWPYLFDRLRARSMEQQVLSCKLIEIFLNRFAEKELRLRTVTPDDAKEAMRLVAQHGVAYSELKPNETTILSALGFSPESASRSFSKLARGAAAGAIEVLSLPWHLSRRSERQPKKRTNGVDKLELREHA